jgi:hypothetical protein
MPTAGASAGQVRRRRGSGAGRLDRVADAFSAVDRTDGRAAAPDATVRDMEASRPEPEPKVDPKVESRAAPSAEDQPQPEGTGADLLTISLLVFFLSLLLIVAGMLVLPNIVH